ncbi:MAG TPA: hypothetical protein VFK05_29830 [Polyangiaceae bacterium]|nr:hypothetical protein [Polyangiaceae bacterium]
MTSNNRDHSADERFERLLIDSARDDEMPSNVPAAWQRFDSALRGASLLAAGAGGALAVRRAQRWLAAKWLIWGALTGSALTAFSLRAHRDRPTEPGPALAVPAAVSALASSAPPARAEVATLAPEPSSQTEKPATRSPARVPPRVSPPRQKSAPQPGSTLAAQVVLLDSARRALARGTFSEALRLADSYHTDFPNGELNPEAETVAIEALIARGERAPALERAQRFFARFPGDPHLSRVKWLVR